MIGVTYTSGLVIAQRDAWESLGSRFSGEHAKFHTGDLWALLGIMAGIAILVALLNWAYRTSWLASEATNHGTYSLICAAPHRLGKKDRKRLRALAESHLLASPSELFLRPDLFQTQNLPVDDEQEVANYAALGARLFAGVELLQPAPVATALKQPAPQENTPVVAPVVLLPISSDVPTTAERG